MTRTQSLSPGVFFVLSCHSVQDQPFDVQLTNYERSTLYTGVSFVASCTTSSNTYCLERAIDDTI